MRKGSLTAWDGANCSTKSLQSIAIAGVGVTEMAFSLGRGSVDLCIDAARAALADAGMSLNEVDGLAARWTGDGGTVMDPGSADWANLLGIQVRWIGDTYPQGVPGVLDAAAAISAGLCQTVLIVGGQGELENEVAAYTRPDNEFVAPWGSSTPAQFALMAQQYLTRFPTDRHQMADVAATIRNAGAVNPEAVLFGKGPYTAEDILAAKPIVEPFSLLDLCLTNEGAAALVVTSLARARACPKPPVILMGAGEEWARQEYVEPPLYDEVGRIGEDSASRAFAMAGLRPQDIDCLQLYDACTFEVVRQLEVLGFAEEGGGAAFAADVGIGPTGRLPVNTDGGRLSHGHIGHQAVTLPIIEAVRQIRGECGPRQLADTEVALCTGAGSGAQYHNVLILGNDRH